MALFGAKVVNEYPEPVQCWTGEPTPRFFTVAGDGGTSPDDVDVDHVQAPDGQWYKCGEDFTSVRLVVVERNGAVRNAKCKTNGPNQDCAE